MLMPDTDEPVTESFHRQTLDDAEEIARLDRERQQKRDKAHKATNTKQRNPETHSS